MFKTTLPPSRLIGSVLLKWTWLSLTIGILVGSASAFFLTSLSWVTEYRDLNNWIIIFLPIAGLCIGLAYHYWGGTANKGNNLLISEYHQPHLHIPFRMFPLVLIGTLITHLFGGSAGREGTAVQMGGTIADQFSKRYKIDSEDRKALLIMGISAGFASVFGTPLAGAIFALEVLIIRKRQLHLFIPSLMCAFIADVTCRLWQVGHTHYEVSAPLPTLSISLLLYTIIAGIIFGVTALLFTKTGDLFSHLFKKGIKFPPLRPFVGGIIIASVVLISGSTRYIGLGIPTLIASFDSQLPTYDFIAKLLLTTFTLSAGFKGGEVTPLFFIGATLGNMLALFVPIPMSILVAMGFVAVFAGATNTPLACTVMGMELFGVEYGIVLAIACFAAYLCSGRKGIYSAQKIGKNKRTFYFRIRKKYLRNL